ncbi:MAG: 50S ribosomal protein L4 [Candidatus Aenigmatarchaeota archaeon]
MAKIYDVHGSAVGEAKLPKVFSTAYRRDLVRRAALALQSAARQAYGTDWWAGKRTSAHYHGMRHSRYTMMNREMARMQRNHNASPGQEMRARFSPGARSGRRCHPPKAEKIWEQKINKKEAVAALKCAIAATASDMVRRRHAVPEGIELPIIFKDEIESLKKTGELEAVLAAMKMHAELERAKEKKVRPGRGKMRGRKYRTKTSFLFVVSSDKGIGRAASNLNGADVCNVRNLNIGLLAPGCEGGRLTIWTESAINYLGEKYG